MPQRIGQTAQAVDGPSPHILLLQGPIGPFFRQLQARLEARGARVTRILFNAGDSLFRPRHGDVRFTGDEEAWTAWIDRCIATDRPDAIVLFGCKRPAHRVATEAARAADIPVVSLEEGYLRSGYITCERNGNNDLSPISGKFPDETIEEPIENHATGPNFKTLNWLGFLYFTTRIAASKSSDRFSFHRPLGGVIGEGARWFRNFWRLWWKGLTERGTIRSLTEDHEGDYILVPLQMPADSQLARAARGWTLDRLIEEVMTRFAAQDGIARLVYKIHPLDNGGFQRARDICALAEKLGVADRVTVLHSGSIAQLATHSDGMIVINSTSGLSAIHHGTPLLVLGDAIFRHEKLVTPGTDADSIDKFFAKREAASLEDRRNYERFVAKHALVPGDYYLPSGRRVAAESASQRIYELAGLDGRGSSFGAKPAQ